MPPVARGRAAAGPGLRGSHRLLPSLPDLAPDLLALVADALALVRVGLAQLAYVGRDLTDQLLVDALDNQPGRGLDAERDAGRWVHHDRVAEAQRELQVRAPGLDPVADPDDLQRLAVTLGDPGDHVLHQGAGQAVQRPHLALVVGPGDLQRAVVPGDLDRRGELQRQAALGARDADRPPVDGYVVPGNDLHREPSDS